MSKTVKLVCVTICAILVIETAWAQSTRTKPAAEPSSFYPDRNRGFDNAGVPSDPVLDALLKTPEARLNWDRLQKLNRVELRKLFLVVRVHLKDAGETDEVVLGKGPMSGADCDWFWVVRDLGGHAEILLFENAYGVYLLESRTNGYRDVRSVAFAGSTAYTNFFHYDGQRYIAVHKFQKEIKP